MTTELIFILRLTISRPIACNWLTSPTKKKEFRSKLEPDKKAKPERLIEFNEGQSPKI
jgi:hypothetical protein